MPAPKPADPRGARIDPEALRGRLDEVLGAPPEFSGAPTGAIAEALQEEAQRLGHAHEILQGVLSGEGIGAYPHEAQGLSLIHI